MKPQHAVLLASDLGKETLIRTIDRFLMYYVRTADRLERTATWLNKLPGGLAKVYEVVVEDKLGIAAQLEAEMAHVVSTYACEWQSALSDPALRARFSPFSTPARATRACSSRRYATSRNPYDPTSRHKANRYSRDVLQRTRARAKGESMKTWIRVANSDDVITGGGGCVKLGGVQVALFKIQAPGGALRWYAVQNLCPHDSRQVLSSGLTGDVQGEPKVAYPLHKNAFSLRTGEHLGAQEWALETFPVKEVKGTIFVEFDTARLTPPPSEARYESEPYAHAFPN